MSLGLRYVNNLDSSNYRHCCYCKILTIQQKADFLSKVGEKTPVFVRFSTVTLGREFPDEARNPRGFAIKFYTMEGNYDIVGLNFVSFVVYAGSSACQVWT